MIRSYLGSSFVCILQSVALQRVSPVKPEQKRSCIFISHGLQGPASPGAPAFRAAKFPPTWERGFFISHMFLTL
ncbi:hypothetical protein N656DRAFT_248260 [Canariomyces notabilis]|uniref:Uncharacterized protein n=1 Tax=Canariomyces notabilis TaxID=2074819 RepID=A0AAN6TL08_9PEZI|nr:hypothetical protein N656DRAFT_248260 [Canariomyces arenarius]